MPKPLVVIATPCFGGMLTQIYMQSVTRLMASVGDQIDLLLMLLGNDALITRSRATLVAKFLDNPDATHLMFIDSDIGFDPEQFARLFRQDKALSAAMYPIKEIDWQRLQNHHTNGESLNTAGLNYVGTLCSGPELKIDGEFATARYVGAGFLLVKREALQQLIQAHPELKYRVVHAQDPGAPSEDHRYALFDPIIDTESGTYLSEDYAFCQRWRMLGGEIWLDLKSRIKHVGANEYQGDSATRFLSAR